jgi:hypothetical protein
LKTHQAAVEAKQTALQKLYADHQRAIDASSQGEQHTAEIATLKQQRTDAMGAAFVRQEQANTAHLDKAISAAEKRHAEALATAEAARAALVLLDQQIQDARAELAKLQRAQIEAAATEAESAYQQALQGFRTAADALLDAVALLDGTAAARDALGHLLNQSSSKREFVRSVIRNQLEIPVQQGDGTWFRTGEHISRWDRWQPVFQGLSKKLADAGIDLQGAPIKKPQPVAPAIVQADPVVRITQAAWQPGQVHFNQPDARIGLVSAEVR